MKNNLSVLNLHVESVKKEQDLESVKHVKITQSCQKVEGLVNLPNVMRMILSRKMANVSHVRDLLWFQKITKLALSLNARSTSLLQGMELVSNVGHIFYHRGTK